MELQALKQALVCAAEKAGIKEYEIYYQKSEDINAETFRDEISGFSSGVSGGICFRCIVNGKMGYASGELMTEEAMADLVRRAVENAKCIDSDDVAVIFAGSPAYAELPQTEVVLADPTTIKDMAMKLQQAMYQASDKVADGTQSAAVSMTSEVYLYNSSGLELSRRVGATGAYASPVLREGEGAHSAFEFGQGASYEELKDLPKKAIDAAAAQFGAGLVSTGKYDVIFDGKQFRSLLSAFASAFSAKNAQVGLSRLAGKEGEVIAASCLSITDDPMRPESPMKAAFDGEGVATYKKQVVENGVLKTLLYDLTTAAKAGKASTGNGQKAGYSAPVGIAPYNFGVAPGNTSEEELFAKVSEGIYITEMKGLHAGANAVTGDFSIESAGFMIRCGKKAEAVKSFTVAGNFFALLKEIDTLGDTVKWGIPFGYTVFGSPDVLVRQMSIAGK